MLEPNDQSSNWRIKKEEKYRLPYRQKLECLLVRCSGHARKPCVLFQTRKLKRKVLWQLVDVTNQASKIIEPLDRQNLEVHIVKKRQSKNHGTFLMTQKTRNTLSSHKTKLTG